jgi:anhydro-N-acetylmuramic acid kinase
MLVAGLMSGTSVDGIDVALVEITGEGFEQKIETRAFRSIAFSAEVRQAVLGISNSPTHTARLSQLNFLLGELFGEAVLEICHAEGVDPKEIELVGSHGQTIYHQATPELLFGRKIASTLQIGEPAVIAARTGAPVVADFRPADMALGGQGAPLVPYVDYLLYRSAKKGRVCLNIGGIANVTAIPPRSGPERVMAFDTGPGNMLIDALVSQFSRGVQRYDKDGRMAASGKVNPELLSSLMKHEFVRRRPPKSCGREEFGTELVAELLGEGLSAPDLVATATAFTAASIADGIERFVSPQMHVDELIVSGGGVHNPQIMDRLKRQIPDAKVMASEELGVNSDAKEAIAFAVLAYETWHERPSNLPSATGARGPAILGKVVRPGLG